MTDPKRLPELLAPAGTWDALEAVLDAGADAVYLGGKRFNMRQHRPTLNFTDEEIARAVELVRAQGKKIHLVLNNLFCDDEIDAARSCLSYFAELHPDAIIIQDLAIARMAREMGLEVPLHASTMMNVHNIEAALSLKSLGVTRIITSRDITLAETKRLAGATGMEFEYFIHGDMCVAQGSLCYQSTMSFGESGNRGRCMKPCRWKYDLIEHRDGHERIVSQGKHLLARNDMCMYEHVPALVDAGVASLKIEGRARSAEFLYDIVSTYRKALDIYAADPTNYQPDANDVEVLNARKVREFSTCAAFGRPKADSMDTTGKREPRFFSLSGREHRIDVDTLTCSDNHAELAGRLPLKRPDLIVKVFTVEQGIAAVKSGANGIYFGIEKLTGDSLAQTNTLQHYVQQLHKHVDVPVYLASPPVTTEAEQEQWRHLLSPGGNACSIGAVAGNLGTLHAAVEEHAGIIVTDFSLNVMNRFAALQLAEFGADRITASIEMDLAELASVIASVHLPVEALVHGAMPGMIMDYCPIASAADHNSNGSCSAPCREAEYFLRDLEGGRHLIEPSPSCRITLTTAHDLCMLPWLHDIVNAGTDVLRIEAQLYTPKHIADVVGIYKKYIDIIWNGEKISDETLRDDLCRLARECPRPLGAGAYQHGCRTVSEEGRALEKILVGATQHS